ncbi:MAG: ATP-binding cassette domain-containing protein, partial [Oscillospiraceae bacterium]
TAELPKKLSAYSGGMKQRLLAAAALMGAPELIIMDEPTAGLDPKERVRLREVLAELAKSTIVLVATHVVSDVESVADEIILLKHGEIVDKASPAALCEKYKAQSLEDVYLSIFGADE